MLLSLVEEQDHLPESGVLSILPLFCDNDQSVVRVIYHSNSIIFFLCH
jgi:hypothetical protein